MARNKDRRLDNSSKEDKENGIKQHACKDMNNNNKDRDWAEEKKRKIIK